MTQPLKRVELEGLGALLADAVRKGGKGFEVVLTAGHKYRSGQKYPYTCNLEFCADIQQYTSSQCV